MHLTVSGDITLVDVAVLNYGSIEVLFDIADQNGLSIDAVPVAGAIDLPVIEDIKRFNQRPGIRKVNVSPFVRVRGDQALIDLAIQEGGSLEALFDIAERNGLGITDDLQAGGSYYKPPQVVKPSVVRALRGFYPASAQPINENDLPPALEGIDYWLIENTFIVN